MKNCRTYLFLLLCIGLFCASASAQSGSTNAPLANAHVDGAAYRNPYLGFEYFIPEAWTPKGAAGKLPGTTNGYRLLTLKRQRGQEQLSSVMLIAEDLSAYGGDLQRFIDRRYRLDEDSEPELLMIGDRAFYRVDSDSDSINRVAIVTERHGYALAFELIGPTSLFEDMERAFVDSMHGLNFSVPAEGAKAGKK
jgi:hypothetical protein